MYEVSGPCCLPLEYGSDHTVLLILFETDLHDKQTESSRSTKTCSYRERKYLINHNLSSTCDFPSKINQRKYSPIITNILFWENISNIM